ncbi:hypothetical protein L218DRAFT_390290 [Marasmius fiardii PR-910]|nr:hypothetical protein L218DRAFT_390290 [Marasmius fiardii PR-910]
MTAISNRIAMKCFAGASKVKIGLGNFSNVEGDQHNNYYNYYGTDKKSRVGENLPRLEEFNEIKMGNILKVGDIGRPWPRGPSAGEVTVEAAFTAEIIPHGPQKKFTVKTYHGGKAKKAWRQDFLRCSDSDWRREVPLFGYSKSESVPLLIFSGELVPVAHIEPKVGWVGRLYFEVLRNTLGCLRTELWLDPARGIFFRGPLGPRCLDWIDEYVDIKVPSHVAFLEKDVVIRYFSNIKHDQGLLCAFNYSSHREEVKDWSSNCPQVISSATNLTVASTRNVRWWSFKGCLGNVCKMPDGTTRFRLNDDQRSIEVDSVNETSSWLSQALSFFYTNGIRFHEDLSKYKLVWSLFQLRGSLQRSKSKQQRRQLRAIYLFLVPSPSPDACFYIWSHDPNGQDPLSPDMCKYLGLPYKLSLKVQYCQKTWPTEIYKALHDYQVARGFDPRTTDFARFMQSPIFKVGPPRNCSEELRDDQNNICSASEQFLPELKGTLEHRRQCEYPL